MPCARALEIAGIKIATSTKTMETTTSNSISVKPAERAPTRPWQKDPRCAFRGKAKAAGTLAMIVGSPETGLPLTCPNNLATRQKAARRVCSHTLYRLRQTQSFQRPAFAGRSRFRLCSAPDAATILWPIPVDKKYNNYKIAPRQYLIRKFFCASKYRIGK